MPPPPSPGHTLSCSAAVSGASSSAMAGCASPPPHIPWWDAVSLFVDASVSGADVARCPVPAASPLSRLLPLASLSARASSEPLRVLHVCRPSAVAVTPSDGLVDAESLASLANLTSSVIPVFTETTESFSHIVVWVDADLYCNSLVSPCAVNGRVLSAACGCMYVFAYHRNGRVSRCCVAALSGALSHVSLGRSSVCRVRNGSPAS